MVADWLGLCGHLVSVNLHLKGEVVGRHQHPLAVPLHHQLMLLLGILRLHQWRVDHHVGTGGGGESGPCDLGEETALSLTHQIVLLLRLLLMGEGV